MKLPVHTRESVIHDATGAVVASCHNPALALLIADRINEFSAQYARGHADATELVNRQRDYEASVTRQRIEQRQYEQALEEEIQWSLSTFVHAA
jgi:hypothetical protein